MHPRKNLKSLSDEVREMHKSFVVGKVNYTWLSLIVN